MVYDLPGFVLIWVQEMKKMSEMTGSDSERLTKSVWTAVTDHSLVRWACGAHQ